jgi:pimeloyl-ACP methyl ester carboxylesterase
MPTGHRWRLGAAALIVSLAPVALAACGDDDTEADDAPADTTTSEATTTTTTAPIPDVAREEVTFSTSDGVELAGTLYGEGTTAIVCSHMLRGSRADFAGGAPRLAAEGYLVLAYDNRGDGESGEGATTDKVLDVHAAIELVRSRGADRVVLLGASRGGALSLEAATQVPVNAVVTLSAPPPNDGPAAVAAVSAPSLYVNSENDEFADSTQEMFDAANDPKDLHIYPGPDHGTALFRSQPGLVDRIVGFIEAQATA